MLNFLRAFLDDKSAVTAIEYGLIAGLIAVAIITVVTTIGGDLTDLFTSVSEGLDTATGTGDADGAATADTQ